MYSNAHVSRVHRRPFGWLDYGYSNSLSADKCLAEFLVKVPEMAESITEGTLKQWSKSG